MYTERHIRKKEKKHNKKKKKTFEQTIFSFIPPFCVEQIIIGFKVHL
jgi:hypothetical protein